jgi:eukaryotic-like serine/threonine-protein kinase
MPSVDTTPRTVGKYRPLATLGEGGMARVLLAVATGPAGVRKLLVVKEIRPELARDAEFVAMFLDEARLAARLSHPNVIHTYEVGIEGGSPFIVMEYLDGQSLQALLGKVQRASMPLAVHLRILTKALAGLHYAHELKDYNGTPLSVVHRDVSPQNVFVCYDGHVKVVDFGVAKVAGSVERTAAGTFKGKIGYIAPEQLSGAEVDRRADVFSVGVMLWEALAQRRLTANETKATIMHKRLQGIRQSVKAINPDVPDELAAICDKATALTAEERFATAAQMQEALEAYLGKTGLRVDERDIGVLVSHAFELERLRIGEIIEQQIGSTSSGKVKAALPNLGVQPPGESNARLSMGPVGGSAAVITAKGLLSPMRNRRTALVGGVVAAVLVLVVWWIARPKGSSLPAAAGAPSATSEAARAAPAEPNHATIMLTIQITPPKATVLLDGAQLLTNPFRSAVPKDAKLHNLSVSAPGYASEERLIEYNQDASIEVVLKRAAGKLGAAPNEMPAGAGSDLKKAPRPKHSIDEEDPYK